MNSTVSLQNNFKSNNISMQTSKKAAGVTTNLVFTPNKSLLQLHLAAKIQNLKKGL